MNLLIPYVYIPRHNDPLFEEFTYGDFDARARKLRNAVKKGDYLFFHATIRGKKCITAYYVVDRILDTVTARKNKNIMAKYKNPHLFFSDYEHDEVMVFGDPIDSRVLEKPLLFNKTLAEKLSLNIQFRKGNTETQTIGSATRNWRELTEKDVNILLGEIKSHEQDSYQETILSTDEVAEILEKDIERFMEKNPSLIGKPIKLINRQLATPAGRIDLLYEGRKGKQIVVELKLGEIGRGALNQLKRYMHWVKKETKKEVKGVIVCKGVMPVFEEDFKKLKDVRIFCYGWQLKVYPWGEKG